MEWRFTGEVIEWRGPAPCLFVAMTVEESQDLQEAARGLIYWGQVPVHATIGGTGFTTALFRRDGRYLVPVKAVVQRAELAADRNFASAVLGTGQYYCLGARAFPISVRRAARQCRRTSVGPAPGPAGSERPGRSTHRPCSRVCAAIAVRTRPLVRVISRLDDKPSATMVCSWSSACQSTRPPHIPGHLPGRHIKGKTAPASIIQEYAP